MELRYEYRQVDFENWKRRDAFSLFGTGEYPYVGLTTMVDVSPLMHACRSQGCSFFTAFVYVIMTCMNKVENFRCRIYEDQIIICDKVDPLFNIVDQDAGIHTFAIAAIQDSFSDFNREMEAEKKIALEQPNLPHNRLDVVSVSCLPWFSVTDIIQPLGLSANGSIPHCVWGKTEENGLRIAVPFSLTAHHGLLDGKHVSRLLTAMAGMMESPDFLQK